MLSRAKYETNGNPLEGLQLQQRLRTDFDSFLEARAALVAYTAERLAEGAVPTLEQVTGNAMRFAVASATPMADTA